MIIHMNLCKTKGVLGSWKLRFSYINEKKMKNENFGSFSADFRFRAEGKKVTSQAEPSRAENPSARPVARASLARTHHYCLQICRKNKSLVNRICYLHNVKSCCGQRSKHEKNGAFISGYVCKVEFVKEWEKAQCYRQWLFNAHSG